jgi:hypothetical protein
MRTLDLKNIDSLARAEAGFGGVHELRSAARAALQFQFDRMDEPELVNVDHALEWAAEAADLPPEELVDLVTEFAPAASARRGRRRMLAIAELALHDYQRIPCRRRDLSPPMPTVNVDWRFLREVARPILARGVALPSEIMRLAEESAWREHVRGNKAVDIDPLLAGLVIEGGLAVLAPEVAA